MGSEIANNKRIAKNTIFLYVRMLFIMAVTLYTARVVLDKLGEVDYGIYGAVGSAVAMLAFLNGTLSTGTSRFLTFELGTGNFPKLCSTFSTAFYAHLFLSLGIALMMETGGMWFLHHKMIIPEERMFAAEVAFHFSVLTVFVNITQVPYTSVIIAHENMSIYAYIGVFEAVSKLVIVYLLNLASWDKLIFYAFLIALVQITTALLFRFYCSRNYKESRLTWGFDKSILQSLLGFSGWSLIANVSETLSKQGVVVVINMFFQPAVVAAQTIGNQITMAIDQFVNGFRTAINPQVIKLYAAKEYEASKRLTLQSSIYVFDLLLLLGLPTIVVMETLLNLWFVKVPEYAVVFAQYIVARRIIGNFSVAFYVPMMASGHLKENSLSSVFISILGFGVLYVLLSCGFSVMIVQYIGVCQAILYGFIVKPFILCKRVDYEPKEILSCFGLAVRIAILPLIVSYFVSQYLLDETLVGMLLSASVVAISVIVSAYFHLDDEAKSKLIIFIKKKFSKL